MKRIRYIIFTSIMFLLFINIASASTCSFGDKTLYFKCTNDAGKTTCTIEGTNVNNLDFAAPTGPMLTGHEIEINSSVIDNCNDSSTIYVKINRRTNEVLGVYSKEPTVNDINTSILPLTKLDDESYEEVNTDLSRYNGNACVYSLSPYKYVCTITNGKPVCKMGFMEGSNGNNFDISHVTQTLTAADFLDENGHFTCTKHGQYLEACAATNDAGKVEVSAVRVDCSEGGAKLSYSPNATDFEGNPGYDEDDPENSFGGDREEAGGGRPADVVEDAKNENEVVENFCTGSRLGVFTTIGWVFWFAKILIPIVLIVLGSIDVGKAVIASKDDEIKKSAKTLVIRVIAGIIIFFIPTLLNLVVDLINGGDIYNGEDFGTCTHCVLEPTDPNCPGLRGE